MLFTTNAAPVLKMQSYQAYNRGDMYVPSKMVAAPLKAASLATAYVGRRPVHSVPIMYGNVRSIVIGSKGMATPFQGGVK